MDAVVICSPVRHPFAEELRSYVFGAPEEEPQRAFQQTLSLPIAIRDRLGKPVIVVLERELTDVASAGVEVEHRKLMDCCLAAGIPVFPSLGRAARVLANYVRHWESLSLLAEGVQ
ncbi:hypothetical protein ACFLVD_01260 [Chloroflexota bacterium]